jgi:hypothetical protein
MDNLFQRSRETAAIICPEIAELKKKTQTSAYTSGSTCKEHSE